MQASDFFEAVEKRRLVQWGDFAETRVRQLTQDEAAKAAATQYLVEEGRDRQLKRVGRISFCACGNRKDARALKCYHCKDYNHKGNPGKRVS